MELQLCNKEQSKKLQSLGFDWETDLVYLDNGHTIYRKDMYTGYWDCPRPTVALAIKYLRKIHNIIVSVRLYNPITTEDFAYTLDIYDGKQKICPDIPLFRNGEYDQAESAGLDAALEYLTK
jgi:hypothetical protein